MWADTEGRVSASIGKVSIGGKSSSVAVREQNSLNIQDALADESGREVSMMDSILVCESDGSLVLLWCIIGKRCLMMKWRQVAMSQFVEERCRKFQYHRLLDWLLAELSRSSS